MAKKKKVIEHLNSDKEIKVELIPVYISDEEFQEKKEEIQNLITKMFISAHKRGRPSKSDVEVLSYAA